MTMCLCVRVAMVTLVYLSSNVHASTIEFQGSTTSIKPLLTSNFTLRCALRDSSTSGAIVGRSVESVESREIHTRPASDQPAGTKRTVTATPDDMKYVTSIIISRDGVDVATVTEHFPATSVGGASGVQVTGQLSGAGGERGFLQVVVPHPTAGDTGSYRCDVDALNSQGHSFDFRQELEVTAGDVSINDLVKHVHDLQMYKEKISQEFQLYKEKTTQEFQKNQLYKDNTTLTILDLKAENSALKHSLESLKTIARIEPDVFFSAAMTTRIQYSNTHDVIYDRIYTNEGAAYNNQTGHFTCPVQGFYHFELHAVASNVYSRLALQHNGIKTISVFCAAMSSEFDSCSNSLYIKLVKGDIVNVVDSQTGSYLHTENPNMISNTFSGKLIALI